MATEPAPPRFLRRTVLGAGLGLAASGCSARHLPWTAAKSKGGVTSSPAAAATGPLPFAVINFQDPVGGPEKAIAALQAFDPKVDWLNYTGSANGPLSSASRQYPPHWGVSMVNPFLPPPTFPSLLPALRRANFDPSQLMPGALQAFSNARGDAYGLPLQVQPTGVLYNTAAFRAAGLAPPAADWTIDDFESACAALQGASRAGRLPKGVYGALPPLAGRSTIHTKTGGHLFWYGALSDPGLWGAFALGFGGSVVRQGRFDLTGTGTVQGIGRLVDIARRYGAPANALPQTQADWTSVQQGAAMTFLPYTSTYTPKDQRYARFPTLPARPVIPATPRGVGLVKALAMATWTKSFPPATVPPEAEDAAVTYALWAYSVARQQTQLPTVPPPPLADAAMQQAYWSSPARRANGGDQVGDWRNVAVVEAAWPATGDSTTFLGRTADIMLTALTQAVFQNADVAAVLADATKQLNTAAAQSAATAAGG